MSNPQLSRLDPNKLQSRGVAPFIVTHLRALSHLCCLTVKRKRLFCFYRTTRSAYNYTSYHICNRYDKTIVGSSRPRCSCCAKLLIHKYPPLSIILVTRQCRFWSDGNSTTNTYKTLSASHASTDTIISHFQVAKHLH